MDAQATGVAAHGIQACTVEQGDALLQRLMHFFGLRRHLRTLLQRQQRHLMAQTPCAARCVERRAATADHQQTLAQRHRLAGVGRRQKSGTVANPGLAVIQIGQALVARRTERQIERIVLLAQPCEFVGAGDAHTTVHGHTHGDDARDFGIEHITREPIGRNAVAHQATERVLRFIQRDGKAHAAQLKRRRQTGWPATDDGNTSCGGERRVETPTLRNRLVADKALQFADRKRLVVTGAVAGGLARVVADAPGYRRKRVVPCQHIPGTTKIACTCQADPLGDVAIDRAGTVTRCRRLDVRGQ